MSDVSSTFTDKLGPLPVWAWGAIGAAASLAIYFVYRGRATATVGTGSIVNTPTTSDGTPYSTSGIIPPTVASSPPANDSFSAWISRAATAVAGQSATSPSDIVATLTNWYEGNTLTSGQRAIVDKAIQLQGQPPSLPQAISPVQDPSLSGYQRNPGGGLSALYSDGTRKDFASYSSYQTFLKTHPGPFAQVDNTAYYSHPSAGTI